MGDSFPDTTVLKTLAEGAFRGPWRAETWEVSCEDASAPCEEDGCGYDHDVHTVLAPDEYPADSDSPQVVAQIDSTDGRIRTPGLEQFAAANARYIAAASPDVVLGLIARIEALEALHAEALDVGARVAVETSHAHDKVERLRVMVGDAVAAGLAMEQACETGAHVRPENVRRVRNEILAINAALKENDHA